MTQLRFFFRTAATNLLHGGQRGLVALLCVAFGVMSLLAMALLSTALERMLISGPQDMIGADITMDRASEDAILPEHTAALDALRQESVLSGYTPVTFHRSIAFHLPGSGELHFPGAGVGIDPAAYPPLGKLTLEGSGGVGLPTLLEGVGDVLVCRDIALAFDIQVGDTLILSDLTAGTPVEARVRGIVIDTPNHEGSKIYYSHATAERLANGGRPLNTVLATAADPAAARERLAQLGWRVYLATDLAASDLETQEMFSIVLNGAGILGLLVSGVGTANTMQVLLRRRKREVAIWKSIGYTSGSLMALFALEAGMLGLAGSLIGAAAGLAVSAGLVDLFSRTSTLLIDWVIDPKPVGMAVLVGTVTAVVFALWAIVNTSRARPVSLLRDEPPSADRMPWFQSLGLLLLLCLPFLGMVSLVMGSLLNGLGVLAFALAGLVVLGGALGGLLWVTIRLLPLGGAPLLNMARGNLKRRGLAPVFALIALFVGVVALTLASVVTENASRVMEEKTISIPGSNLIVLAPAGEATAIEQAAGALAAESVETSWRTRVRSVALTGDPSQTFSATLEGRDEPGDYFINGAEWGSRPDGVYLPAHSWAPEGASLTVTLWDGSTRELPVVGEYEADLSRVVFPDLRVLVPSALSRTFGAPDQVQVSIRVPDEQAYSAANSLGAALPQATVVNMVAYAARFTSNYHNLFVFAISMASLALLAGVMLMANSVSLAMLDRRYEIGVLKAMGYARGHVLVTLVVEYVLIALVATGAGLAAVKACLWVLGMNNTVAASLLVLTPASAAATTALAAGLTLATVLAVTWNPTRVSPLVVLNDRG